MGKDTRSLTGSGVNHSRGLMGASKTWGMNMAALIEALPWWDAPRKMMKTISRRKAAWAARLTKRAIRFLFAGWLAEAESAAGPVGSFMV